MNEAVSVGYEIPWIAVIIAGVSVFAVVFISMLYSKIKINKMNIIENIKNENI